MRLGYFLDTVRGTRPQEWKMLECHLLRVIHHRVYNFVYEDNVYEDNVYEDQTAETNGRRACMKKGSD